jgi:hypothetical protein
MIFLWECFALMCPIGMLPKNCSMSYESPGRVSATDSHEKTTTPPEEIIKKLRSAEEALAGGKTVEEVPDHCGEHGDLPALEEPVFGRQEGRPQAA